MALYLEQAMVLQLTRIALRPKSVVAVLGVGFGSRKELSTNRRDLSTQALLTRKRDAAPENKQERLEADAFVKERRTNRRSSKSLQSEEYDDESAEQPPRPRRFAKAAQEEESFESESVSRQHKPAPRNKKSIKERQSADFCPFNETTGFASLNLSKAMVDRLEEVGLTTPTEVQASAIPVLLQGHDAAMQSYTGSGKTLAYLLPMLSRIGPLAAAEAAETEQEIIRKGGIEAVIVAPSRELAMQIVREVEKLIGDENRKLVQQLIGGANMKRQAEALKKNKPLIIVGTPGRISEFSRSGKLHTHDCKFLVLDEADQILSMKYRGDMKRILEHVGLRRSAESTTTPEALKNPRVQRQTVLVSATMPPAVLRAAQEWGHKPLLLKANSAENVLEVELERSSAGSEAAAAGTGAEEVEIEKEKPSDDIRGAKESLPPNLAHYYVIAPARHRVSTLKRCILALNAQTVLVFMNFTQRLKDTVFKLEAGGIDAACLHGEKGKLGRANTLAAFRNQKLRVLVVSEVGARGLDVPECDLVVNLELPTDATHYAHRAGRTGRLGREGTVLSICEEREKFVVNKFEKQLGVTIEKCEVSFGVVSMDMEKTTAAAEV